MFSEINSVFSQLFCCALTLSDYIHYNLSNLIIIQYIIILKSLSFPYAYAEIDQLVYFVVLCSEILNGFSKILSKIDFVLEFKILYSKIKFICKLFFLYLKSELLAWKRLTHFLNSVHHSRH